MIPIENADRHLSPLELDSLLLPDPVNADMAAHLRTCAHCATARDERERDARHFQRQVFSRTLPEIERHLVRRARGFFRWPFISALALPALATAVLLLPSAPSKVSTPVANTEAFGIKGEPQVSFKVFARRNEVTFEVSNGMHLLPGDHLRFQVQSGGTGFLMVGSVDGALQANVYTPFDGTTSVAIGRSMRAVDLPGSVILDDIQGEERLFAVFSAAPIEKKRMIAALTAHAALPKAQRAGTHHLQLDGLLASQSSIAFTKDKAP